MNPPKNILHLIASITAENPSTCYNATVISFVINKKTASKRGKKIPYKEIGEELATRFSISSQLHVPAYQIRNLHYKFEKLVKHVDRNWDAINIFLNEIFLQLQPLSEISPQPLSEISPIVQNDERETVQWDTTTSGINVTPPKKVSTPVKTRKDCENCASAKKINFLLRDSLKAHKSKLNKARISESALKKDWHIRSTKQKLKRHGEKIDTLKRQLKSCEITVRLKHKKNQKLTNKIEQINKENIQMKKQLNVLQENFERKCEELQSVYKERKQQERYIEYIDDKKTDRVEEDHEDHLDFKTKDGKTYNMDVRLCIYNALLCNVPVNNCGWLVKKCVELLCHKKIDRLPCPSTCAQMGYEIGIVSTLHLMETMLKEKHLCLSWDATTVEGAHVNEIHLTANRTKCLVLDVRHIPGGKTSDYVSHIMGAFSDAAAVHAKYTKTSQAEVLTALKQSISATLTDRAAVNGAVTRQLCTELDTQILRLNCNIHPLDSVARFVKASLIKFDAKNEIKGNCYGTEGSAGNLIKAISILRFKDGTGDPLGFKNFLRAHDLPVGTFPRYVGNRLHILFHLAGLIILHRRKLIDFVEKECTAAAIFRTRVLTDLKNCKLMVQIWALAVVGKIFTGPWMTKFYSSTMSNLEMGPLILSCTDQLSRWVENPDVLIQPTQNVFGESLDPAQDEVLSSITSYDEADFTVQLQVLEGVLMACLCVLQRQLSDFLTGEFASPTNETMELGECAPTHNIASERALGCLDRMWRQAPNATAGFLSGKVRSKMNKSLQWLENKSVEEQKTIINFVISEAKEERAQTILEQKELVKEVSERRREVSIQRKFQKKKSLVRKINKALRIKSCDNLDSCLDVVRNKINDLIHNREESFIGSLIIHTLNNTQWYARILQLKKGNSFLMGYWSMDLPESSSVDFTVPATSFFADVIMGDVLFM